MRFPCPQCGLDLNLGASKVQDRALNVRCSRCQQAIVLLPTSSPAPPKEPAAEPAGLLPEIASLLKDLVRSVGSPGRASEPGKTPATRRRVLVCVGHAKMRDDIVTAMGAAGYDVNAVDGMHLGLASLQDCNVDVLFIDSLFEMEEQGYETLMNYISDLNPKSRRRLFVVLVSPQYKTLDSQAAFAEKVNLVVNPRNLPTVTPILERGIREFNEFYREFNHRTGSAPL